jgi:cerevisin
VSHKEHPDSDAEMHHYIYDHDAGQGVTAYVVDTGVNIGHNEFEGRAEWFVLSLRVSGLIRRGQTIPDGDEDKDGNGHGTHVAYV